MHGSYAMTSELISGIASQVAGDELAYDIMVCPPAAYLSAAITAVQNSVDNKSIKSKSIKNKLIKVGAQNVHAQAQGAYTGEISLDMLSDIGCQYTLLGHSERRQLFAESDADIATKFAACVNHDGGIRPVLCVGETLAERTANNTQAVVAKQLDAVLEKVGVNGFANAVIAYEPVWAIGTGETASPAQAQQVHAFIRAKLAELDETIAQQITIVYGGSVKPDNAQELFSQADIDGGLIGGASLRVDSFVGICAAAQALSN